MPFPFSTIDPQTTGKVSKWDIPINTWMGVKFGLGRDESAGIAVGRMLEDWNAEGDIISADQANEQFGIEGHLKFDEPIASGLAALRRRRKEAEIGRMAYLQAASHSPLSWKGIVGFGSILAGSMAHPLDIAASLVPFVGSAKAGAGVARLGGGAFRQRMAKGILTNVENLRGTGLPVVSRYPELTASVVNAMAGQAAVEIPVVVQKIRDQGVYGPVDAVFNVAAGGLFGAGVHGVGALFKRALGKSAKELNMLEPETTDAMARKATRDFIDGTPIRVDHIPLGDENFIRAQVNERIRIDQAKIRAEAEEFVGPVKIPGERVNDVQLLAAARKQLRDDPGSQQSKFVGKLLSLIEEGDRDANTFVELATLLDKYYDPLAVSSTDATRGGNVIDEEVTQKLVDIQQNLKNLNEQRELILKSSKEDIALRESPAIRKELMSVQRKIAKFKKEEDALIRAHSPLTDEELLRHAEEMKDLPDPAAERLMPEERERQIQEMIKMEVEDINARRDEAFRLEVDRLRAEQEAVGEGITEVELKDYQYNVKTVVEDTKAVLDEATETEATLRELLKDEALPQSKREMIEMGLESIDEIKFDERIPAYQRGVEAAIPCVLTTVV